MRQSFIVNEVVTGLRRNISMTIAMILTTAISLALFGGGLLVARLSDRTKQMYLSKIEVQLFLTDDLSAVDPECIHVQCQQILHQLHNEPGVVSVTYLSKKQALDDAVNRVFAYEPEIQKVIQDTGVQATIRVKVENSAQIDKIIKNFTPPPPGVDGILDQRSLIKKISHALNAIRNVAFLLAILQAVAAIVLIANTVQMAALSRRTEVSIMSIVGATRWYRQLPFLLEAVIAALIGSITAVAGLFFGKKYLVAPFAENISGLKALTDFSLLDVLLVSPLMILTGVFFSLLTGYITLRIYVPD